MILSAFIACIKEDMSVEDMAQKFEGEVRIPWPTLKRPFSLNMGISSVREEINGLAIKY